MEIEVTRRKFTRYDKHATGGEYATATIQIRIDESLPLEEQRRRVIHSVIENYCRNWTHENVEELEQFIVYGLSQLEEEP